MIGTIETKLVDLSRTLETVPLGQVQLIRNGHTIAVKIGDELFFDSITAAHTFLNDGGTSHCLPDGWNVVDGWCTKHVEIKVVQTGKHRERTYNELY
jgi:hypothetical protein